MTAGRPLKFTNADELKAKIKKYFAECDPHPIKKVRYEYVQKTEYRDVKVREGRKWITKQEAYEVDDRSVKPMKIKEWGVSEAIPYTITGLAVYLDTSRVTLIEYEDKTNGKEDIDPELINTIKEAKAIIESYWELKLIGNNAAGIIFNLKNNYKGWHDKQEQEITNPDGSLNPYANLSEEELRNLAQGKHA